MRHFRLPVSAQFVVLSLIAASAAQAQESKERAWSPVPLPSALFSPTSGFGAGIGWNVRNGILPDDRGRVRLRAQQFRQSAEGGWASTTLSGSNSGFVVSVAGYRNLHERFYGTGATAARSDEHILKRIEARAEVRYRWNLERGFWLQPRAQVRVGKLQSFRPADGTAVAANVAAGATSSGAAANLSLLLDAGSLSGADIGVDAGWTFAPEANVQVYVTHRSYQGSINQTVGGFLIQSSKDLRPGHRLAIRISGDRTFSRSEFVPYFLQARLDDRLAPGWDRFRFYGNDRFVFGATYLWPLVSILRSHVIQGVAALTVSQVYEDVLDQFSPSLALAPDRDGFGDRYPVEPTFGLGWQLLSLRDGDTPIRVTLGFSAEGFVTTSFQISQDLSDWYSAIR